MREMPKLNPRSLDPPHHSAAVDWDHSDDTWSLDDTVYVSEPKSLKWPQPTASGAHRASLCKHEGTIALNEGRVVTWIRHNHLNGYTRIYFRNQAPVGTANHNNCYFVAWNSNTSIVGLRKVVNGNLTLLADKAYGGGFTYPVNEWRKVRVTWWEDGGVLYVRVEWWNGAEWVQICDDFYDPDNLWSGETVNRCGVGTAYYSVSGIVCWFDDTEIWGP